MSISFFEPPPSFANEEARDAAVTASGAIAAEGDAGLIAIMQDTKRDFAVPLCVISVIFGETQHVIAADTIHLGAYSRRHSFCGHVVAANLDFFCVPDLSQDPRFADNPWVDGDRGRSRFYAAAVLRWRTYPIGALCIVDERARPAPDADMRARLIDRAGAVMKRLADLRS